LGLFPDAPSAARGVRAARQLGIEGLRLSIVARTHEDEVAFTREHGGSPGADLEHSPVAARLAELGASVVAALALVLPGIGPIVAAGPLGVELGEVAGHAAGDLQEILRRSGLDQTQAHEWHERIAKGAVLIGAHVARGQAEPVAKAFAAAGAAETVIGTWATSPRG
jgi:hypothetical protein